MSLVLRSLDVGRVPVWQAADSEVVELVNATERAVRALAGLQLEAIAQGVSRGLPFAAGAGTGAGAPGRWLRSLIPITAGDAARRASLADALFTGADADDLTPTREAVLAGAVSTDHAGHVVSALARLRPPSTPAGMIDAVTVREAQVLLLQAATGDSEHAGLDPHQIAKAGVALTSTLDPGAGDRLAKDEDRQSELRAFCVTPLPSGMFHAAGLLTKEVGHALFGVLQSLSAPRPSSDGTPDPRSARMRMHDGLGQALRLLHTAPGRLPGSHGSANRLVVSVPARALVQHLTTGDHAIPAPGWLDELNRIEPGRGDGWPDDGRVTGLPELPELPGRWPLSPLSAQVMACDAELVAVLTGPDGSPLDVGDTVYPFPARQRAAIIDRDRRCTFATCTAPPDWCDIHHLVAFSRGGPTAATNGALLCGTHHRFVHARSLVGRLASGRVTWQASNGADNPHLPPVAVERAIGALAKRWRQRGGGRRPRAG